MEREDEAVGIHQIAEQRGSKRSGHRVDGEKQAEGEALILVIVPGARWL